MMNRTPELRKAMDLVTNSETDRSVLVKYALVSLRHFASERSGPDNYFIQAKQRDGSWFPIQDGTKDFCIGYATADGDESIIVTVGESEGMIVWPEDRWGELFSTTKGEEQ